MSAPAFVSHYRLSGKLGEGGMGEVWRATDTKLNREVAVKILPDAFAHDADRMARFQREAQVLASLNHPNIASIYGVEERAIVLELVDGSTLAERIAEGPIPLAEALDIAKQIIEALESAHDCGIVHRDLKPANIKLTSGGRVKVLDFGLAKAMAAEASTAARNSENSPTLTLHATGMGVILGTAAYMAPEQAKGKPVDRRADIWAFGVVLYEMLTGERLFTGETVSDVLAAVLTKEPDWAKVPKRVQPLLQGCLERDPKRRLRDIGDAWRLLDEPRIEAVRQSRPWLPWAIAAVLAVSALGIGAVHLRELPRPSSFSARFFVPPPSRTALSAGPVISPDGQNIAFVAGDASGNTQLYLRPINSFEARAVTTIDDTTVTRFWTPDSRSIVFQGGTKLKKIGLDGGAAQTLGDAPPVALGGTISKDGVMLVGGNSSPIMRMPLAGGPLTPVTKLESERREIFHTDPIFLPDGKHFFYFRHSAKPELQGIYLGVLDVGPEQQSLRRVEATDYSPAYQPAAPGSQIGYLLLLRNETLLAQPFDEARLTTAGDPVPIAEQVGISLSRGFFSVSNNGVLVYRAGGAQLLQIVAYTREGQTLGTPIGQSSDFQDVALSPDQSRVAYTRGDQGGTRQVWICDLMRGTHSRFSFASENVRAPVWSRDGRYIAFSGFNNSRIYVKDSSGAGDAQVVAEVSSPVIVNDWSPDAKYLLFTRIGPTYDIGAVVDPLSKENRKQIDVITSPMAELHGQISPNGQWIAYTSSESGRNEIYVQPFPPGSSRVGKWLISTNGGQQPRWRSDGKELFYLATNRTLTGVDVNLNDNFRSGLPRPLFAAPGVQTALSVFQYDVYQGGSKFILIAPSGQAMASPLHVILNWQSALQP